MAGTARATARALAILGFTLVAREAAAQLINPTESTEKCPDGSARLVWDYPYAGGIPANATYEPCGAPGGCPVFLSSACLQLVEVKGSLNKRDRPPVKSQRRPAVEVRGRRDPPVAGWERPAHPGGITPGELPPPGAAGCKPGTGWDFEEVLTETEHPGAFYASLKGWRPDNVSPNSPFRDHRSSDLDFKAAPVYGNAVSIDRIRPPGWLYGMERHVGGDYWTYSQSVNQHGDFWLSSLYRRYSWRQHPGDRRAETDTGTLTSPPCALAARFLTFRMSGSRARSQRVELQAAGADPRDYFGIAFPGGLGDAAGHATQWAPAPVAPQAFPPPDQGEWVVVRSATVEDEIDAIVGPASVEAFDRSEWMQTYVFDLAPFQGQRVRIRIVDDARGQCLDWLGGTCAHQAPEHVNADYLVFSDQAPAGTRWMKFDGDRCGGEPGTGDGCSPVGRVPSQPPLWGVPDAHAHPMANLGFGGHVFWGDVADKLEDVYDCSHSLPALPGPGGRPAILDSAHTTACHLAGDVVVVLGAAAQAGCSVLSVVPVVGLGAASLCKAAVSAATVALLATPVLEGLTLHGARKFSSGAVKAAGLIFSKALIELQATLGVMLGDPSLSFDTGLMAQVDAWPDAVPTLKWYRDDGADDPEDVDWHSYTGLAKSHNLYQADMVRRAHQGGLRLGVWDVVNSRALAFAADGEISSDWKALKDETDAAKRIVSTVLKDVAAIAYTPVEAAAIVRQGKLAVILGAEVDELGRLRPDGLPWPRSPHASPDTMQQQVDDLWELGIRKVTPVHAVNNPIGGPAIFDVKYAANNHFLNGTPVDGEPSFKDLPAVRFVIDRQPWVPFELILGQESMFREVGGSAHQPWNPGGWFNFELFPPTGFDKPRPTGQSLVGEHEQVTYRLGEDKPKDGKLRTPGGSWLPPDQVLGRQILVATAWNKVSTFVRPIGRCALVNTFKPAYAETFGPTIDAQFTVADGHRNALGVFRSSAGEDGERFLRAAMKKGLLLDVDHMSQRMRDDVYALARAYAGEAGFRSHCYSWDPQGACTPCGEGELCGDYPFMGVHTTVRNLEKGGSGREDLLGTFGSSDESSRTPMELEYVTVNGGTVGVFPRGSALIPPNTDGGPCRKDSDCAGYAGVGSHPCNPVTRVCQGDAPRQGIVLAPRKWLPSAEVENDCDTTSKTFAVKYLWLMMKLKGRGLTLTTDLNGMIGTINPRYGGATPGKEVCGGDKRWLLDGPGRPIWKDIMVSAQEYEHSGVWYDDYAARGAKNSTRAAAWTDGNPQKRWREVVARKNGEIREDWAPRLEQNADEKVYFNDHGPALSIYHWYDQGANGPGAQLWPMKRWDNARAGWDFNLDGLQHIGLLPDLIQDMRNVGVQWEQLGPLFRGTQDFIDLWGRSVAIGAAHP
jgi:microsomal dipeptidase-like Zn-dependent dipeptidase